MQSKLGWTEAALVEGAKDAGLSPAIVGAFPRREAALVEVGESYHAHFPFMHVQYDLELKWSSFQLVFFLFCCFGLFVTPGLDVAFILGDYVVQFFMEECNRHLEDEVEAREKELSSMLLAERIAQIVRLRLQMQIPFLSKWPQALSIQVITLSTLCLNVCLWW